MKTKVKLVVIGHKDHGKSTLIGRLIYNSGSVKPDRIAELDRCSRVYGGLPRNYAFLIDSFEEERRDGLTMDTVNIPYETKNYHYSLIDCPGHRELIKHMMTGASDANAALLVVSAKDDEGIQAQTIDHLRLIRLLGISTLLIAISKMDASGYSFDRYLELISQMQKILGDIGYDAASVPFIPVSSIDGENLDGVAARMPWYSGIPLSAMLDKTIFPSTSLVGKPFRLPVQDIYMIRGTALIVGTVEAGSVSVGDDVCFQPSGKQGRVVDIMLADRQCHSAGAGESIGIRVSEDRRSDTVRRGEICGHQRFPPSTAKEIMVQMAVFKDMPVANGQSVVFHSVAGEVSARIEDIQGDHPYIGARIVLEKITSVELFNECQPLGRFMTSDGDEVTAAGVITALLP